jgi:hypothetical protein
MKRAWIALSIAAVFGMALYANAYAGSTEGQNSQGQENMGMMAPFETPGSTSAPSGGFGYYGADFHGAPVENPQAEMQSRYGQAPASTEEGQAYRPFLSLGSTTPSSGGFGYYGAEPYTEIENPERQMQTQYGQAPSSTEEEGQWYLPFLTPGSTTPPSGGFGYY